MAPSLSLILFPFCNPAHLQTIHNTGQRWRSPRESASSSLSSSSSSSSSFVVDSLYPSLSQPFYLSLSHLNSPFLPDVGSSFALFLVIRLASFAFAIVTLLRLLQTKIHLPSLLLCLHPSLSFFWFVCSAIELMISVCIAHFMHNFRKFSLRFGKRMFEKEARWEIRETFSWSKHNFKSWIRYLDQIKNVKGLYWKIYTGCFGAQTISLNCLTCNSRV